MNELEKAYQEIERWYCYSEQDGFVGEEEISYLDYVKKYITNLQSKIDKAIDKINQYELIVGYYDSNYDEYDDTYSHEIKDELLDILKEDK